MFDLNKQQVAVGVRLPNDGGLRAHVWTNGQGQDLPTLDSAGTSRNDWADEINDHGQIVGYSLDSSATARAVTWVNGAITDLTPGPDTFTAGAFGINNTGVITGSWNAIAVEWANGTMHQLGVPRPPDIPADATTFSDGRSINEDGDIAGYVAWFNQSIAGHIAFLWSGGSTTFLNPASSDCVAYGINIHQEIVGECNGSISTPFYWHNGVMSDPGLLPGGYGGSAQAINDKGTFVGWSIGPSGIQAVQWR